MGQSDKALKVNSSKDNSYTTLTPTSPSSSTNTELTGIGLIDVRGERPRIATYGRGRSLL